MSLFGGKSERLQAEISRQSAVITTLEDQIDRMADLLADANGKFDALLESHQLVLLAHRDAAEQLKATQNELEKLRTLPPAPTFGSMPLHVPEWEEDAAHQLEQGLIDKEQYAAILREAGLAPNIEVDLS